MHEDSYLTALTPVLAQASSSTQASSALASTADNTCDNMDLEMNLNPSQDLSVNHDALKVDKIEFLKVVKGASKQVGEWKLIHKPK